jgi:hypothetical protein
MFRTALRAALLIWEVLAIVSPLLRRGGRRQRLPLALKDGVIFVLANWELIWKYLEKRNWSIETMKNLLRFRRFKR